MIKGGLETKSKIKEYFSIKNKVLSGLNVMLFFSLFCYIAFSYADLPDRILSHFGINGNIDAYAYKCMILVTPIVFAVICVAMELLRLFPLNIINLPFKPHPNAYPRIGSAITI